jgi:hypothetical protein
MKLYRTRQVTVETHEDDVDPSTLKVRLPSGDLVFVDAEVFHSLFEPLL